MCLKIWYKHTYIYIFTNVFVCVCQGKKVLPGLEPGSEDSESSVITSYTIGPYFDVPWRELMFTMIGWPSGLRRQLKALFSSEARVRTPLRSSLLCTPCSEYMLWIETGELSLWELSWPSGLRRQTQVLFLIRGRGFEPHWKHFSCVDK